MIDLSQIGITGRQAHATRTLTLAQAENSIATARSNAANAQKQEFENNLDERAQAVEDLAASTISSLAEGRGTGVDREQYEQAAGVPRVNSDVNESAATPLLAMAEKLRAAGLSSRAMAFTLEAHKITDAEGKSRRAESAHQGRQMTNGLALADLIARHIGTDQGEDAYNVGMEQLRIGRESGTISKDVFSDEHWEMLSSIPYAKGLPDFWGAQSMTVRDKLTQQLNEQKEARQAATDAANIALSAQRNALSARRDAETVRNNALSRKNGGDATVISSAASAINRLSVSNALASGPLSDYEDNDKDKASLAAISNVIAEDTAILIRGTPGLEWAQAQEMAIAKAIERGFIVPTSVEESPFWFDSTEPSSVDFGKGIPSSQETQAPRELPTDYATLEPGVPYNSQFGVLYFSGEVDEEGNPVMTNRP